MIDGLIGVEQLQLGQQVVNGLLVPVEEAVREPVNQAGETGLETLFNIIEIFRWTLLGLVIAAAGCYALYGCWLLMRAPGNPQMMDRAKTQIGISFLAAAIATGVFLGIGAGIDLLSSASGGTTFDVGDVSRVNNSGREVPIGTFLGIYGGSAVLCPGSDPGTAWTTGATEGSVGESWIYVPADTTTGTPAFCRSQ